MTDYVEIAVGRQDGHAFNVGRDDEGPFVFVRDPHAPRFEVSMQDDYLQVAAMPRPVAESLWRFYGIARFTSDLGYQDLPVDEVELEAFVAYPGANFGVWAGGSYTMLPAMWGYPEVLALNENWVSLGTRTAHDDDNGREVYWPFPTDVEPSLGSYVVAVIKAPVYVDAGIPSLQTLGGYAYHPSFTYVNVSVARTVDMTRNYVYSPALNTPLLMTPANYPTWPPAW